MKNLKVVHMVLGMLDTNGYMIYQKQGTPEHAENCILVDPADNAPFIIKKCTEMHLKPEAILLTHGHFDHLLAAEDVRRAFHAPIYAGEKEAQLLENPSYNLTKMSGMEMSLEADRLLRDGEVIEMVGTKWNVLSTPGHTEGSVCFYAEEEDLLISGDTLFCESVGRTDLPTGDGSKLFISVTEKLFSLPDDTRVFPGHGEDTTIGHEKKHNYYV